MNVVQDQLLVTGASGHLGKLVINHLLGALKIPGTQIIATTRHPESLSDLSARGVAVRKADFDDPTSLAKAFDGARRILLISTDALDRPGRRLAQHKNAIDAAVRVGAQHVVYTSMPNPENSPLLIAPDHLGTEQALAASNLTGWTVLRNNWYFENLFMNLPRLKATGQWFSAAGNGRIAHIARADLARAAAVALARPGNDKSTLTLTGSEAFTTADLAQLLGAALGESIQIVPVPVAGLIQGMVGAGLPEPVAAVFASFDTNTSAGRVAEVTDHFQKLTGSVPIRFGDWLASNKAAVLAV
jgi:NAD(P)H dehydrogenase (quinone)